jgi:hypothetical protein
MSDTQKLDEQAKRLEEIRRQHELDKAARDIVRRLAEWKKKRDWCDAYDEIAVDAAALWLEMQEGGDK